MTRMLRDPAWLALGLGVLVLWGPLAPELVRDWERGGDFSHGWLVPLVAVALVVVRRDLLSGTAPRPYWPGIVLLAAGLLQYLAGVAASEFWLQRAALVPFLGGWILALAGPAAARILAFPVLFLLFMIPPPSLLWNGASLPLQLLASRIAETTVGALGVPAVRAGNVIHLPNCSLEVAAACSGLRSLVALLALGAVLAEGSLPGPGGPRRTVSKVALFLAAIPVAVAVNALRVAGTTLAAAHAGRDVATGPVHELTGIAMFALSLAILWMGRRALAWIEPPASGSQPSS